jgi:hypothetical protein
MNETMNSFHSIQCTEFPLRGCQFCFFCLPGRSSIGFQYLKVSYASQDLGAMDACQINAITVLEWILFLDFFEAKAGYCLQA